MRHSGDPRQRQHKQTLKFPFQNNISDQYRQAFLKTSFLSNIREYKIFYNLERRHIGMFVGSLTQRMFCGGVTCMLCLWLRCLFFKLKFNIANRVV